MLWIFIPISGTLNITEYLLKQSSLNVFSKATPMPHTHSATNTTPESEIQTARLHLKWFNSSKGFGFLVPEDGSFDAFIHITTLQDAGLNAAGEGAIFDCEIYDGDNGKQVRTITEVIETGEIDMMTQSENEDGSVTMGGLVKWYKPEKGFGFIIADDGQKDVFLHKSLLDRLEIDELEEGQRVKMTIKGVDKGREAIDIKIIR